MVRLLGGINSPGCHELQQKQAELERQPMNQDV